MNKPFYDTTKPNAFFALGLVSQKQNFNDAMLQRFLDPSATIGSISCNLTQHYNADEIRYFEYDSNGNPHITALFDDSKTAVFAIDTDCYNANNEKIYAQYNRTNKGWIGVFFNTENNILQSMNQYKMGILSFKNYSSANDFICDLEKMILPGELWKYSKKATDTVRIKTDFQILESYLTIISTALAKGNDDRKSLNYGKIKISQVTDPITKQPKTYALFNTGLLTKYATDILIVGEKVNAKWQINNPFIVTNGVAELAEYGFSMNDTKPDMVSFFKDTSEIVYNANIEVDLSNINKLQHCIDDGIKRNRFPDECKKMYETGDMLGLMDKFKAAINRSVMIARRNYKYVIPQYRNSANDSIQFLMPIYMLSHFDKSPDFALVLSLETINGTKYYKPETVLELAWAYNNARAICKPDNTWLNPDKIEDCAYQVDET